MQRVLLLSNSTMPGTAFFSWPKAYVREFLPENVSKIVFIPFAAVTLPYDEYETIVQQAFAAMGLMVKHHEHDMSAAVQQAQAIVVGGGNSFALLSNMYRYDLLNAVKQRVAAGVPYIGWSAGANLACPTIMTTNDMPIIVPPSLEALHLVPFQINPHYHELKFENQGGETRKERLEEFLVLNPEKRIIGLPEGMLLQREDARLVIKGTGTAKLYEAGKPVQSLEAGADLSHLV
jgi:dipeptidase E